MLDYDQQFDQAGVLVRASETAWVKAGVEISDGVAQVGAVVTHTTSDWSVAPVSSWSGSRSRSASAEARMRSPSAPAARRTVAVGASRAVAG